MKFKFLAKFFSSKQVEGTISEKADGGAIFNEAQAAAMETMAEELETTSASLVTATERANTAEAALATATTASENANAELAAIRTELAAAEGVSSVDAIRALNQTVADLNARIEQLGEQAGTMGTKLTKDKDNVDQTQKTGKEKFLTSFDAEAEALLKEING